MLFVGILWPGLLWCQRTTTNISGTITDSSGGVVPAANLTATQVSTGATYKAVSDAAGYYILNNLPPDQYRLQVESPGFKTYVRSSIILEVDQSVTLPVTLEVGSPSQTINVTQAVSQVDTVSSTVSTQVTAQMARQLPLNGRNILQLMALAPDTGPSSGSGYQQSTSNPDSNVYVAASGGRGDSVNFYLDGALNEDSYTDIANAFPNPDAIGEFSFETNNYSAKYGGRGGRSHERRNKKRRKRISRDGFRILALLFPKRSKLFLCDPRWIEAQPIRGQRWWAHRKGQDVLLFLIPTDNASKFTRFKFSVYANSR